MIGCASSPAANHLFNINEDNPTYLDDEKKDVFVHIVMQLLYLSQRARPDIRTAISFLCTRLNKPDMDDYKKLTRVVKYLQTTKELPLILSCDGDGRIRWWVDASFAVHHDMRGHTGATMSFGRGSPFSMAIKQKLNSRSLTEAEVIGVHDAMPQLVWTNNFLRAQDMNVVDTVLYQDNMSSILLEKNGQSSSTKRTRHMNIRYFCVKDMVDSKEISIEHCPTKEMIGDYFTKPLQGKLFRKMRDAIMGTDLSSPYHANHKECVEENVIEKTISVIEPESAPSADVGSRTSYKDALMTTK